MALTSKVLLLKWFAFNSHLLPLLCKGREGLEKCNRREGFQHFLHPNWGAGALEPDRNFPAVVLVDLDVETRFNVSMPWEDEQLFRIPGYDPCLFFDYKAVPHYENPRRAFASLMNVMSAHNGHLHSLWGAYNVPVQIKSGVAVEGLRFVMNGRAGLAEIEDKAIYPNFVRSSFSTQNMFQPMWGFYRLWNWKSFIFVYSTEPVGIDGYNYLLIFCTNAGVPRDYAHPVPLRDAVPVLQNVLVAQLSVASRLPVRIVITFGNFGWHTRSQHTYDFKSLTMIAMMDAGLWMPHFQIVQDDPALFCDLTLDNTTFQALHGQEGYGSFFTVGSVAREAVFILSWLPALFRCFVYVGYLANVDMSQPAMVREYGLDIWDDAAVANFYDAYNNMGGLDGFFWGDGMIVNVIDIEYSTRELIATNCFLQKSGAAGALDAKLLHRCMLTQSYLDPGTNYIFPFDYDGVGSLVESMVLYGRVWVIDDITNVSSPLEILIVWCEGVDLQTGCRIADASMGTRTPVWGDGSIGRDVPKKFIKCMPAMFRSPQQSCKWCPAGRFSDVSDSSECTRCLAGRFSKSQATSCKFCRLGFFASESGSEKCVNCPTGAYADSKGFSQCIACPRGSFSNNIGASACQHCDKPLTTEAAGQTTSADCICDRGFYFVKSSADCTKCLEGLACDRGWPENWAASGGKALVEPNYFSWGSTPHSTYLCSIITGSCPGGAPRTCDGGRAGFLCTKCESEGYHIVDGVCKECLGIYKLLLPLAIIFSLIGIAALYYLANGSLSVTSDHPQACFIFAGIVITVLQIFGVLKNLGVQWPQGPYDFMQGSSSVFALDANAVPMTCALGENAILEFALANSYAFVLAALTVFCNRISIVCGKILCRENMIWIIGKTLNVIGQIFQALFIAFCIAMVRPLQCYAHPNSKQSVGSIPSVLCWEGGDHTGLLLVSSLVLAFFIMPFAAWCIYGCFAAPKKSSEGSIVFLQQFRFLLYRFRPDRWWWGVIFLLRQTALAFSTVVPSENPHAQLFYASCILLFYVYFVCVFSPWIVLEIGYVDSMVSGLLLLVLLSAMQFLPVAKQNNSVGILVCTMVALGVVCTAYIVIVLSSILRKGFHGEFGGEKPHRRALCNLFVSFLNTCEKQTTADLVQVICHMNDYDRQRMQDTIYSFAACTGNISLDIVAKGRLSNIPNKSFADKIMLDGADVLHSSRRETELGCPAEHLRAKPRNFQILASAGSTYPERS